MSISTAEIYINLRMRGSREDVRRTSQHKLCPGRHLSCVLRYVNGSVLKRRSLGRTIPVSLVSKTRTRDEQRGSFIGARVFTLFPPPRVEDCWSPRSLSARYVSVLLKRGCVGQVFQIHSRKGSNDRAERTWSSSPKPQKRFSDSNPLNPDLRQSFLCRNEM